MDEEPDPRQRPMKARTFDAAVSEYRTGRLAHGDGEPPGVQITAKNFREVQKWERIILDGERAWRMKSLAKYLDQVASCIGITVQSLLVVAVDLLEPINPYMGDLSEEQARKIEWQTIMNTHSDNLAEERHRQKRASPTQISQQQKQQQPMEPFDSHHLEEPGPTYRVISDDDDDGSDIESTDQSVDIERIDDATPNYPLTSVFRFDGDSTEPSSISSDSTEPSSIASDQTQSFNASETPPSPFAYTGDQNQTAFGKSQRHRSGGAPMAPSPQGLGTQDRYARPLTDLANATNNPAIAARLALFYRHSNQKSVLSIISSPQFNGGDVDKVVKSSKLSGWEQSALGRLMSQPMVGDRFDDAKPSDFYEDNGARRAFAELVSSCARHLSTVNTGSTQMSTRAAAVMVSEAVIKCMACVWKRNGQHRYLAFDNGYYGQLTQGGSSTTPSRPTQGPYAYSSNYHYSATHDTTRSIFY